LIAVVAMLVLSSKTGWRTSNLTVCLRMSRQ
jgi:hypothetical protein